MSARFYKRAARILAAVAFPLLSLYGAALLVAHELVQRELKARRVDSERDFARYHAAVLADQALAALLPAAQRLAPARMPVHS